MAQGIGHGDDIAIFIVDIGCGETVCLDTHLIGDDLGFGQWSGFIIVGGLGAQAIEVGAGTGQTVVGTTIDWGDVVPVTIGIGVAGVDRNTLFGAGVDA